MSIRVRFLLVAFAVLIAVPESGHCLTQSVGRFQAINIPLPHPQSGVKNVWDDVSIITEFSAPSGRLFTRAVGDTIGGFYHSKDLWMVRFTPDEIGTWHYKITLTDRGAPTVFQDSFYTIASTEQGFIRSNGSVGNELWYYSGNGKLYSPLGFGDCMYATRDSILQNGALDGGFRTGGINETPDWVLPYAQYLISYGDVAGFNLYRYSDGNCAYTMVRSIASLGNDYDTLHSRWTDTLFSALRQHGFRVYMTLLSGTVGSSSDPKSMAAVERYAQFCIDRFGPLVDFWELTNESSPDSLWVSKVATYIHIHDPYHHLVSMSWELPNHPAIDIISPHWYGREDVLTSDQTTADHITQYQSHAKPVIFGEQGEGTRWDSLSAIRMRGRIWSALFNAGALVFWNTTFAKDCPCNEYLGWEERRYVRVLQNFQKTLLPNLVRQSVKSVGNCKVWGMSSTGSDQMAYYIRNDRDINAINSNITVDLTQLAKGGEVIWYDVHTGDILQRIPITMALKTVTAPPFRTDIAMIAGGVQDSLKSDSLFRLIVTPRTSSVTMIGIPVRTLVNTAIGLRNTSTAPITITAAIFSHNPAGNFYLDNGKIPFTIAPSDSQTLILHYMPLDTGIHVTMLSLVQSSSPSWENIAITATAVPKAGVDPIAEIGAYELAPNPANSSLVIRGSQASSGLLHFEIFSISGQKLLEGTTTPDKAIDIRSLENGAYEMMLNSAGIATKSLKFSIQR